MGELVAFPYPSPRPRGAGVEGTSLDMDGAVAEVEVLQFTAAASLADLEKEFVFFSIAVWTDLLGLRPSPLDAYLAEHGKVRVFVLSLPSPVFGGMSAELDRQLFAVAVDAWQDLFAYLSAIAVVSWEAKQVVVAVMQKLPVVDVLALAKKAILPAELPRANVFALAVRSNLYTLGFHRAAVWDPWVVRRTAADPKVVAEARRLFTVVGGGKGDV